eukprot:436524-Prymnesium_polylepis.3
MSVGSCSWSTCNASTHSDGVVRTPWKTHTKRTRRTRFPVSTPSLALTPSRRHDVGLCISCEYLVLAHAADVRRLWEELCHLRPLHEELVGKVDHDLPCVRAAGGASPVAAATRRAARGSTQHRGRARRHRPSHRSWTVT